MNRGPEGLCERTGRAQASQRMLRALPRSQTPAASSLDATAAPEHLAKANANRLTARLERV